MTDWPEVTLVQVYAPEEWGLKANALRLAGEPGWTVFISSGDDGLWLAFMDVLKVQPLHFDADAAEFYAKTAMLLGEGWAFVWEHAGEVREFQRRCLDGIGPNLRRRIDNSSVEDIAEWRAERETVTEGEYVREQVAGVDPLAGRN